MLVISFKLLLLYLSFIKHLVKARQLPYGLRRNTIFSSENVISKH